MSGTETSEETVIYGRYVPTHHSSSCLVDGRVVPTHSSARARTRGSIGMRAEARRSWHPAFARWFGEKSEADAAKASATRRPTRLGFARIAESVVPDARVATPAPLFELALKCVPRSRARDPSPNASRHVPRAPSPRALGREPRSARARVPASTPSSRPNPNPPRVFTCLRVIRKTSGRPSPRRRR